MSIFDFFFTQTRFAAMYSEVLGSEEALQENSKKKSAYFDPIFFWRSRLVTEMPKMTSIRFFFFFEPSMPSVWPLLALFWPSDHFVEYSMFQLFVLELLQFSKKA